MAKLSDLIKSTSDITSAAAPSQFAMHALSRNTTGELVYTKALWANTSESISMTSGPGLAYNGIEEFISGIAATGTIYNETRIIHNENVNKNFLDYTYTVRISNPNYSNASLIIHGLDTSTTKLNLEKGVTYTFNTDDFSTQNHPIYISTIPNDINYANEYKKGVTYSRSGNTDVSSSLLTSNNTLTSHPLVFNVSFDSPSKLYLSSGTNANCYIQINIIEAKINMANRKYEQVRFDNLQVTYYLNSQGYLVARYGADYSYS
jgi:hypothetical protein